MSEKNDNLLEGLISLGCRVEGVDGTTLVSLPDDSASFVFERLGGWLYLGTTFMAPEEFTDFEYVSTLDHFLLELHHRNLGCRFSYADVGFLSIGAELYPNQQKPDDVLQIMEQISFIFEVCRPMCEQIIETGQIPSGDEIDDAFGVCDNLH